MLNEPKAIYFTESELKEFLSTRRVLVVSAQANFAKAVRKLVMQYGSRVDHTLICTSFEEARQQLTKEPTHLLLCDFQIENHSGLQLITVQESKFPNRIEVASLIMCDDPSSSSTGTMAEANVDAVLIKPFNADTFREALFQAVATKVDPPPFWRAIEEAKDVYFRGQYEEAAKIFNSARELDAESPLPDYYLGEIHTKKKEFTKAIECYSSGLRLSRKDYRCLVGLFDAYMLSFDYESAYQAAVRLHQNYPVSATRIVDLVKVSIHVKKYEDILDYYRIFKDIEQKDPALTKAMIAGMLICSKYLSLKADKEKGIEVLKTAAKVAGETGLLRGEVLRYYIANGFISDGERFYNSLPEELKEQLEYKMINLELLHAGDQPSMLIKAAQEMINTGMKTARLYELMIENSKKLGRGESAIENLTLEAHTYFKAKS